MHACMYLFIYLLFDNCLTLAGLELSMQSPLSVCGNLMINVMQTYSPTAAFVPVNAVNFVVQSFWVRTSVL